MASERKYVAASIPRSVRAARIGHLPVKIVIGCWYIKQESGAHVVYDVIMLPADQYLRVKMMLAAPEAAGPAASPGAKFAPPYIPKDVKEVIVPEHEVDPESFAKNYFLAAFNLTKASEG